jgi:hypothetical protein
MRPQPFPRIDLNVFEEKNELLVGNYLVEVMTPVGRNGHVPRATHVSGASYVPRAMHVGMQTAQAGWECAGGGRDPRSVVEEVRGSSFLRVPSGR